MLDMGTTSLRVPWTESMASTTPLRKVWVESHDPERALVNPPPMTAVIVSLLVCDASSSVKVAWPPRPTRRGRPAKVTRRTVIDADGDDDSRSRPFFFSPLHRRREQGDCVFLEGYTPRQTVITTTIGVTHEKEKSSDHVCRYVLNIMNAVLDVMDVL